eukprot:15663-Heterococcus_DN1.PRE.3
MPCQCSSMPQRHRKKVQHKSLNEFKFRALFLRVCAPPMSSAEVGDALQARYQCLSISGKEGGAATAVHRCALNELSAAALLQTELTAATVKAQPFVKEAHRSCCEVMKEQHEETAHYDFMTSCSAAAVTTAGTAFLAPCCGTALTATELLQKLPFLATARTPLPVPSRHSPVQQQQRGTSPQSTQQAQPSRDVRLQPAPQPAAAGVYSTIPAVQQPVINGFAQSNLTQQQQQQQQLQLQHAQQQFQAQAQKQTQQHLQQQQFMQQQQQYQQQQRTAAVGYGAAQPHSNNNSCNVVNPYAPQNRQTAPAAGWSRRSDNSAAAVTSNSSKSQTSGFHFASEHSRDDDYRHTNLSSSNNNNNNNNNTNNSDYRHDSVISSSRAGAGDFTGSAYNGINGSNGTVLPNPAGLRKRKFEVPRMNGDGSTNNTSNTNNSSSNSSNSSSGGAASRGQANSYGQSNGQNNGSGNGSNGSSEELPSELQHCDADMVEKITKEIMQTGDPVTFSDIAGLEGAKKLVVELVCWPMQRPELFTGMRNLAKGLLLFGPPGTGKTLM